MNVKIYEVNYNKLDFLLPKFLEKLYLSKDKLVILLSSLDYIRELDKLLWKYSSNNFLPHGTFEDNFPELQPIYLTLKLENPNSADNLLLIYNDVTIIDDMFVLFNNIIYFLNKLSQSSVDMALNLCKESQKKGYNIVYWKQDINDVWSKISESQTIIDNLRKYLVKNK